MALDRRTDIYYDLLDGENRSIHSRVHITTLFLNGRVRDKISGHISPPSSGWRNGSYNILIYAESNDVLLSTIFSVVSISIYVESPNVVLREPSPLEQFKFSFLGGVLGALLAYVFLSRKMRTTGFNYRKPKIVGVHCGGVVSAYNVFAKEFLSEPEKLRTYFCLMVLLSV